MAAAAAMRRVLRGSRSVVEVILKRPPEARAALFD